MTQSSDYRSIKAVSNSLMSVYEDDFSAFVRYWVYDQDLPSKSDDSLVMGSAIDTLLTRPEEFEDKFIIYSGISPTGQMLQFCYALANTNIDGLGPDYQMAYNTVGFKRDTLEKVKEKFESFRSYFKFLLDSKGKGVLSNEQADKAKLIVQELSEGQYTKHPVNARSIPGKLDVYNQLELKSEWRSHKQVLPIKGALDRVIVDHGRKFVVPIDFKSSFDSLNFEYSYVKWRYYRQGSFYSYLLRQWLDDQGLQDYTIGKFLFVVCSTSRGRHFTYQMSETDINAARNGGLIQYGYKIKGWKEILNEICYLQGKDSWDYPYEAIINNGIVPLNVFRNND